MNFVRQEHIIDTNCKQDIFQATDRFVNNRVKRMDSLVHYFLLVAVLKVARKYF